MHTHGYRPCFVAGTPLKDSLFTCKPIEEFRVGDLILSKNDADPNAPVAAA
jgi:hypothetical protein